MIFNDNMPILSIFGFLSATAALRTREPWLIHTQIQRVMQIFSFRTGSEQIRTTTHLLGTPGWRGAVKGLVQV
jgi:hypothetical protein